MSGDSFDAGFVDADGAREIYQSMQRERLRAKADREAQRALVVCRQAELLVELLDNSVDYRRLSVFAVLRVKALHQIKLVHDFFVKSRHKTLDSDGHRDLEATKPLDPRFEQAKLLFEIGSFVSSGHSRSLSEVAAEIAKERRENGHSLSGGGK